MTSLPRALVIGGTGPTGPFVVRGLVERGFSVTMAHTGRHERPEIPDEVEHLHTDPFDREALAGSLGSRSFEVAVVMYGRLRDVAQLLAGRVARLITVGGMPVVDGYGNPEQLRPAGMPMPTLEDGATVTGAGHQGHNVKVARMVETERAVFAAHPTATHLRYPLVYGPHQLLPREWMVVRRVLDGRRHLILPDGGLYVGSATYVENAAHALLLAVDRPERSAGETYHVGDERAPSLRQVVEIVATALAHSFEIVDLPYELARPAHPLMLRSGSFHRYTPPTKLMSELGYRDVVPCEEALVRTARWLAAHPPERGGDIEQNLQDPFDYGAEDALIAAWKEALGRLRAAAAAADPYFVDRYSPSREADRESRRTARARAPQRRQRRAIRPQSSS